MELGFIEAHAREPQSVDRYRDIRQQMAELDHQEQQQQQKQQHFVLSNLNSASSASTSKSSSSANPIPWFMRLRATAAGSSTAAGGAAGAALGNAVAFAAAYPSAAALAGSPMAATAALEEDPWVQQQVFKPRLVQSTWTKSCALPVYCFVFLFFFLSLQLILSLHRHPF